MWFQLYKGKKYTGMFMYSHREEWKETHQTLSGFSQDKGIDRDF